MFVFVLILLMGIGFTLGGHFLAKYAKRQSQMSSVEDVQAPRFSPGLRLSASGTAWRTTGILCILVGLAGSIWSLSVAG